MDKLLCHICSNMFSYTETLRRHLGSHNNSNFHCLNCKYSSPRKDASKRHSKKHNKINKTTCRQLLSTPKEPVKTRIETVKTRIETKAYQADPTNTNSYINQQSLQKNKEIFPFYMNWMYIPRIQDHITNQNQSSSLMKQMNYYKTQGNLAYLVK